jgi:sulfoacetaldehyde dehydrogenase
MRLADLVVATGSQANVRAAYASGYAGIRVGAGNVAAIVDADADLAQGRALIARSKTFDNATSCSSENSVSSSMRVYDAMLARSSGGRRARRRRREGELQRRCGRRASWRRA